jgi:hypothetical protein
MRWIQRFLEGKEGVGDIDLFDWHININISIWTLLK